MSSFATRFLQALMVIAFAAPGQGITAESASPRTNIKIMPLGDSITRSGAVPGGYRTRLCENLTKAGCQFTFVGSSTDSPSASLTQSGQVHHEGHGSIRIDQIEANLDADGHYRSGNGGCWFSGTTDRAALDPDVILLLAGANDVGQGANATRVRDRLDSLIDHIFRDRPNTALIVSSLTPVTGRSAEKVKTLEAYNIMVPVVVAKHAKRGRSVFFLDMHGKLTAADVSKDGVHPNQQGYDKMGDAWFAAMQTNGLIRPRKPATKQ